MNLRRFQKELRDRGAAIAAGRVTDKFTRAAITPGGGKTYGAELFSRQLLDAKTVDYVVWLVPSASLVQQVRESFIGLRECDNNAPLVRSNPGEIGYVATFQAVLSCPDLHAHFAARKRILLVIDEGHHLPTDGSDAEGAWTKSVYPTAESAKHVLIMSGTLCRHDGRRIAFMDYKDGKPSVDIEYTRSQAVAEGAKLHARFEWLDAPTEWTDRGTGSQIKTDVSVSDPVPEKSMAWQLAGHPSFYRPAVTKAVRVWASSRSMGQHKNRAQLLVVVKDQAVASDAYDVAKIAAPLGTRVEMAVSDRGSDAKRSVARFREGSVDILVTVAMAYEGMDAPRVTHIACLTGFRSVPWIEQCVDRGTRIDWIDKKSGIRNADKRVCTVMAPQDPMMVEAWEQIEREQFTAPTEPRAPRDTDDSEADRAEATQSRFVLGSVGDLRGGLGDVAAIRNRVQAVFPWAESLPDDAVVALAARGVVAVEEPPQFDFDEERRLKQSVEVLARRNDRDRGYEHGTTNKMIVRRWNKRRDQMTIAELRDVAGALREGKL